MDSGPCQRSELRQRRRLKSLGCRERALGLLNQLGEAGGVLDGDISQNLAIQLGAGLLQAVDELRVAGVVQLAGSRDTNDPQRSVLALLLLAAGIGKLQAALDGFLRCLVELGFRKEISTCSLKNFFAAVTPLGAAFYAGHSVFLRFCVLCFAAGGRRRPVRLDGAWASSLADFNPDGSERSRRSETKGLLHGMPGRCDASAPPATTVPTRERHRPQA